MRLTLLPGVIVLVVIVPHVTLHSVYYTVIAIFLDHLNGQFDKTISYFLIKLGYFILFYIEQRVAVRPSVT